MKTRKFFIIDSIETQHSKAAFGILPISSEEDFDLEAKNISESVTVIKESAFDKKAYPKDTHIVIVECLPSDIKSQTEKTITLRWGGNIAHITTAGEYDPKNRQWRNIFWCDLHRKGV